MTKLLILSNLGPARIFKDGWMARALGVALEESDLSWTIHDTLSPLESLSSYDVVLSWRHQKSGNAGTLRRRIFEIEEQCKRLGVPIVNSLGKRSRMRHSFGLSRWKEYGILCADAQRFSAAGDIRLRYPLVLRVDGGSHSALDSFLARTPHEAAGILKSRAQSHRAPLNLAIEFVDTKFPDGYYRKRRTILVGGRLLPRQHMISTHWKIKLGSCTANRVSVEEDRRFMAGGEEQAGLVLKAGRVLGSDVMALDYSPMPDGRYIFWEANGGFRMAGANDNDKSAKFRAATGRSRREALEEQWEVGRAIVELIQRRANRRA